MRKFFLFGLLLFGLLLFGLMPITSFNAQIAIVNIASANDVISQPRFNDTTSINNSVQNLPNLPINPNLDINFGLGQIGSNSNHTEQISQSCGNRCCIYQDRFYSEGSIVQVAGNILLMCQADPNSFGAGSLRWQRLQ